MTANVQKILPNAFLSANVSILIQISLEFVPRSN